MNNKKLVLFSAILLVIVLLCTLAPFVTSHNPDEINLLRINAPPSAEHILGCDELGRDMFSRLLYGGRISITIGIIVAIIQLAIGLGLGMGAGYFGGWIDISMLKLAELIQCFPFFILAMSLVAIIGPGFQSVVVVLSVIGWPAIFLLIRAETLKLREAEFVSASKVLGASHRHMLVKHIFPNLMHLMLVQVTFSVSTAILSESSLSFLGMGIMPPHASWGNILTAARTISVLQHRWWQWLPAGISIFVVIMMIMLIGRALNDTSYNTVKK